MPQNYRHARHTLPARDRSPVRADRPALRNQPRPDCAETPAPPRQRAPVDAPSPVLGPCATARAVPTQPATPFPAPGSPGAARLAVPCEAEARRHGLEKLVQALFREKLLNAETQLIADGPDVSWLPLWGQRTLLRFEGLHFRGIGACRLSGDVHYYAVAGGAKRIATPSELLRLLAPALPIDAGRDVRQRLCRELDDSVINDALGRQFRRQFRGEWQAHQKRQDNPPPSAFIAALQASSHSNPPLLLEQWGSQGHPWHPTDKAKLGFSPQEVRAYSPEFQPEIQLAWAALKAERAHLSYADPETDYAGWFAAQFPALWQAWFAALEARGMAPEGWLPLPLHPYQAEHVLPARFSAEIAAGDLMLLPGLALPASPTLSLRTVVPNGSATTPHIKLPVSVQLTSAERTVSPKSTVMGPRLTRLLCEILKRERNFDGRLEIVPERIGLHVVPIDGSDDSARHLSVLYRDNPASWLNQECLPIPVAALFAASPHDDRPIAAELVKLAHGDDPHDALAYFARYAATVLPAVVAPYLRYGIAFEAHQQNSYLLTDRHYAPARLLLRDFGDLRVHGPTLRREGLELVPYKAGFTVFDTVEPVRDKLIHASLICHLGELALRFSEHWQIAETKLWSIMRHEIEGVFDATREGTDPQRWQEERHALLDDDWPTKCLLRMRLQNSSDDIHVRMTNPLGSLDAPQLQRGEDTA